MKLIQLTETIEAQLIGDTVYIYSDGEPEVLYIDEIEQSKDAERLIISELEFLNSASLSSVSNFEF